MDVNSGFVTNNRSGSEAERDDTPFPIQTFYTEGHDGKYAQCSLEQARVSPCSFPCLSCSLFSCPRVRLSVVSLSSPHISINLSIRCPSLPNRSCFLPTVAYRSCSFPSSAHMAASFQVFLTGPVPFRMSLADPLFPSYCCSQALFPPLAFLNVPP